MMLSQSNLKAIKTVSTQLDIADPQWLTDVINFETGGTFSPLASNPRSSAKGLIQFINSTARGLGYTDSTDLVTKHPEFNSQLEGPVYRYLKQYGPYNSEYQLYMAIFYPAAIKYSAHTPFKQIFQDRHGANWRKYYSDFETANPGIKTPQDYVNFVKKKPVFQLG